MRDASSREADCASKGAFETTDNCCKRGSALEVVLTNVGPDYCGMDLLDVLVLDTEDICAVISPLEACVDIGLGHPCILEVLYLLAMAVDETFGSYVLSLDML